MHDINHLCGQVVCHTEGSQDVSSVQHSLYVRSSSFLHLTRRRIIGLRRRRRLKLCFYVKMIFIIDHFLLLLHLNLKVHGSGVSRCVQPFPSKLLDSRCEDFNTHFLTFRQHKSLFLYDFDTTVSFLKHGESPVVNSLSHLMFAVFISLMEKQARCQAAAASEAGGAFVASKPPFLENIWQFACF